MWYIASEENQAYLAHHGVKGMKWGVRKSRISYNLKNNIKRSGLMAAKGADKASSTILKGLSKAGNFTFGNTKATKALSNASNKLNKNAKSLDKKRKNLQLAKANHDKFLDHRNYFNEQISKMKKENKYSYDQKMIDYLNNMRDEDKELSKKEVDDIDKYLSKLYK